MRMNDFRCTVVVFIQVALILAENKTGDHVRHEIWCWDSNFVFFFWVADMWLGIRDPGCFAHFQTWQSNCLTWTYMAQATPENLPKGDSSGSQIKRSHVLGGPWKSHWNVEWSMLVSVSLYTAFANVPFWLGFFHITNYLWGRQIQNDGVWSRFFGWLFLQSLANVKCSILQAKGGWLFPKIFKQNPTGILLEMMPFDKYFSNELKPPTSNQYVLDIVFTTVRFNTQAPSNENGLENEITPWGPPTLVLLHLL